MQELLVDFIVSLDGYAAADAGPAGGDWRARVTSSTLKDPLSWPNTRLVTGDATEAVTATKGDGDSPMRPLGSVSLCRPLLEAGLADRFRFVVFPVITGKTGRDRFFDGYPDVALDMVTSETFDGRLQLLEYVPTVLTGPPTAPRPAG